MLSYDFPLNEKMRTFLRVEALFVKVAYFIAQDEQMAHHAAILTLLEILEVSSRADLKTDLLHELERSRLQLGVLRNNPFVDPAALASVQEQLANALLHLRGISGKFGQQLRDSDWLMSIKQRATISGGLCKFDIPSYHYWLNQDAAKRKQDLGDWIAQISPLQDGVAILLHLLRDSGCSSAQLACRGTWQQVLHGRAAQLLRISLPNGVLCYPEVSANRYAINIRFLPATSPTRATITDTDVPFDLMLCSL